jgi:uncharacterized protein YkuJ
MADQIAPFKYWAFLSYSHHDKRVAKRLVAELAAKTVPRSFRNRVAGRPARFAPVFRDESDVPVAPSVEPALNDALDHSARLIVICSPFAVASSYVTAEIKHFLARGRAADILCLAASGIPNATDSGQPELECLPRPLRERMTPGGEIHPVPLPERPLAAVLGEESKLEWAAAVEQLTSGLLGVSQTELRRLEQRLLLKRTAAAAAAALVLAAGGYFAWQEFFAPHTTYYRDFERRYGVWHGIDPISQESAQKLSQAYVFTTRGKRAKPARVRFVAPGGSCANPGMMSILGNTPAQACSDARACEARFGYTDGGDIHWEALYDQFGRELERLTYSTPPSTGQFVEGGYGCKRTGTGIQYVAFERHASGIFAGLDKRRQFTAGPGAPRRNNSGVHGVAFEYDPNTPAYGRISRETYIDANGALELTNSGYAGWTSTFNARGQQTRKEFFGRDGAPIITKPGYAAVTYGYDSNGNLTEERYFDTSGKPVLNTDGIAGRRQERDERGLPIADIHLDREGKPSANNKGIAITRHDYDELLLLRRSRYFSADDQPAYDETGAAGMAYERNALDLMLSHTALDRDGITPVSTSTEATTHRIEYDPVGNRIRDRFFGPDGSPALDIKPGVAGRNTDFDSKSRVVKVEAIGLNGELVPVMAKDGFGREDELGSVIGAASYASEFDDAGNETKRRWFGVGGASTVNIDGYAGYRLKYDDRGRGIEMAHLDREGKIGRDRDGTSFIEYTHDDWDRIVEVRYLNAERKPHELPGGSTIRYAYDERGNETEVTYFDSRGAPSAGDDGFFRKVRRLDALGRVLAERTYSKDGKPFEVRRGRHGVNYTLDERGRVVREENIGVNGRPALSPDDGDRSGFDFMLDAYGRVVEKRGRCFEKSPCAGSSGIAIERTSYDRRGWAIERRFFGENARPATDSRGVHGERAEYNDFGKVTRHCTIGTDGGLAPVEGVACTEAKYNERNLPVETKFFDASGAPARGCASQRVTFDDWGRQTVQSCHAADGSPAILPVGGFHRLTSTYDDWSNLLDRTYFDRHGKRTVRVAGGGRISRWNREYDIQSRVVRERYFDVQDKPVADDQGVHEIRRSYAGAKSSFETFDVNGRKIVPRDPTRYRS